MPGRPPTEDLERSFQDAEQKIASLTRALQEYRQNQGHYRLLFMDNPNPMWVYDLETLRILAVNRAALHKYGYSRQEFLAMTIKDIRPPEDVPRLLQNVAMVTEGIDQAGSWRHMKKDGTIIDVDITSHTLVFEGRSAELVIALDITERNRIETALRESEARFKSLFEHAAIGMVVSSLQGELLEVNARFAAMLGYTPEQMVGTNVKAYTHPDDLDADLQSHRQMIRGVIPQVELEKRYVGKDGLFVWGRLSSSVVRGEQGRPLYLVAHIQDITERKQAEQALRLSEDRYRAVSRLTSDLAYAFKVNADHALESEWVTGALERISGYSKEEIRERGGWEALIKAEDRPLLQTQLDTVLAGRSQVVEYRIITRDGRERWLRDHARPAWDDRRGRIVQIYGAVQDITERKQAELALKESHATLRNILDSIDATIYVADIETHQILFMNQYMKDEFGGDHEGQICWQVFRNADEPCAHCTNAKLRDAGGSPSGVYVWEGQNPITGKWYLNHDRAIKWLDGRCVRLQIATDITRFKDLEDERLKTEAQLRQSQKMEAIGTLAGGIAHDFNNILSAIIGYTELSMMEVADGSSIKTNLSEIYKASNRAKEMVKQILAFSRQSKQERKPIRICPLVEDALRMLRATLPANIEISTQLECQGDIVEADATQVQQVLMNLCTNAAHAMRLKGGMLEVALNLVTLEGSASEGHPDLRQGSFVVLRVRDNGHGIKAEDMGRIFDPYFSTKDKSQGTGLGLAVVQGIVKAHGGAVTVDSQPGQGTTFQVYLPRVERSVEEKENLTQRLPHGHERILFVDDEQALVQMGCKLLKRLGYTVETRTSSVEALELFKAAPERFDLVITDMTMPNMTGEQLARALMAIRPDLPVVLCTGYSEQITEAQAKALGIRAFVMKPLPLKDLAVTIRQIMDQR